MDFPLAEGSSYLSCHSIDTEMLDYIWPSQQLVSSQPLIFLVTCILDFCVILCLFIPLLLSCFKILEHQFHSAQLLWQCLEMKAVLSSELKWISKDEEDFWLPDPFAAYNMMYQCWLNHLNNTSSPPIFSSKVNLMGNKCTLNYLIVVKNKDHMELIHLPVEKKDKRVEKKNPIA